MPAYSYDKVTSEIHHYIELTAGLVHSYIRDGKRAHANRLIDSLYGAFRLWEMITRGDQEDGDALRLEQAIEKLKLEASPPINMDQSSPSPYIQMLARWNSGEAFGEDALNRMQQFGFVFPNDKGVLVLTKSGAQVLKENGLG